MRRPGDARLHGAALALALAVPGLAARDAAAQTAPLDLPPGATLEREVSEPLARYDLPTGPWRDGVLPTRAAEGAILRQAWRIEDSAAPLLAVLGPLRAQLVAQGYDILLDCETETCGGFDFRFATEVLSPPEMYVDLGGFFFLSAATDTGHAASLLVSRSTAAIFVQIVRVAPAGAPPPRTTTEAAPLVTADPDLPAFSGDLARDLEAMGRVALSDLTFETGSATLGPGPYASLVALAGYLRANPEARVALVGHTDAEGPLDGNIALSRRRAASVLERLVEVYAIPRRQLDAQGMGYLAPLASNLTPEGREANRRVEVIVLSAP